MIKRTITAIVALLVFVPLLIFSHTWFFPAAIGICIFIAIFEAIRCIGQKKNLFLVIPLCATGFATPMFVRFASLNNDVQSVFIFGAVVSISVALYIFTIAVFGNKTLNIADAGLLIAMFIYVNAGFSATVYIRDFADNGFYLLFLPFIVAWVTDTMAYFSGRLLGKHKLIPAVSPKKTVEGAIGGTLFGAGSVVLFAFIIEQFFKSEGVVIEANYIAFAIFGILIPIVGQIGDLIMSVIKRNYGIKDYGKFFPGHGGMLDRFDSAIANCLILAIACTYFDLLPNIVV